MRRAILTVISGSVGAQLVMLLAVTYGARHLGPEAFGLYALVFAIAAPLGLVGTLRLETAFIFLDDDFGVARAGFTAVLVMAAIGFAVSLGGLLLERPVVLYAGALAVFLGANAVIINMSNYRRRYLWLAAVRMGIAVGTLAALVAMVMLSLPDALILSALAGQGLGLLAGLALHGRWLAGVLERPSLFEMRRIVCDNAQFTLFNGAQSLFSALQETVVVLLITSYLGVATVGVYSFAQRILRAPITVASEAIGRVTQIRVQAHHNDLPEVRRGFFDRLLFLLLAAAAALALGIFMLAAPLTRLVLGAEWALLDRQLPAMSLYMAALFIGATVAVFPLALGRPRAASVFGMAGTTLYVAIVFAALACGADLPLTYWIVSALMPLYFLLFVRKVRSVVTG